MNDAQRICVFYSHGEHFNRVIKAVRTQNPTARLCALLPAGYHPPDEPALAQIADEILWTERANYGPSDAAALKRLVQQLRAGHYDRFIILFETLKLRGLAALSGAAICECWTAYGIIKPVDTSLPKALLGHFARILHGRLLYLRIWCSTHLCRARTRPPGESGA